jgi:hypothetical protein
MKNFLRLMILLIWIGGIAFAQKRKKDQQLSTENASIIDSDVVRGLKFRSIGPALTSGRIADFAVREDKPSEYYVCGSLRWGVENLQFRDHLEAYIR